MVESKSGSVSDMKTFSEKSSFMISENYRRWACKMEKNAESKLSRFIVGAYRIVSLRRLCLALVRRVEGGEMHSVTLRRLLRDFHGVAVGRYSYGPCLVPGLLPPGTLVGNYCSMAEGLRVFRRNHPIAHLSQHPFFYNKELGLLDEDRINRIQDNPLRIGHDVWIGAGVTILPDCKTIGNGAIVGAGSIVTRDIMPYTISAGNPARCIGDRFSEEIRALVEQTQWWELSLSDLGVAGDLLVAPVTKDELVVLLSRIKRESAAPY